MLRKDMEVAQKEVSRAKSELDLKDDERNASRKSVLDGIMILRSSSMFRWRSLKNLRVIRSRCVLRVGGKRTLNKHPLGGGVLRMGELSFLTKLLVKL